MELKKLTLISAIALGMFACGGNNESKEAAVEEASSEEVVAEEAAEAVTYNINAEGSSVAWKGEALGSHWHTGIVPIQSGMISVQGNSVTGGEFVLNTTGVEATDENYTEEEGHTKADFVGHIKADDFLAADQFPEAKFVITSVEGDQVTGDFTIRDVTDTETATVTSVEETEEGVKVEATLTFDRQKYNVSFGMKDIVIADDVPLTITLVATK